MVEILLIQFTTLAVYIAGRGMPTDAFTQIIDRQDILGNTMHVKSLKAMLYCPRVIHIQCKIENGMNFVVLLGT